jgi:predicted PP-loop superfamily ATPase
MTSDEAAAQWCADAAAVLRDTALRAGRLAAAVATDWLDPRGREWAERIAALHRDLANTAHEAEELARRLHGPDGADQEQEELSRAMAAALRVATAAARSGGVDRSTGPQLGDTSGAKVDDEHGAHIAELPDFPP